ncbi:MAG: polysaccharide deacetylase family protein [Lachnospiraceae bacterium]
MRRKQLCILMTIFLLTVSGCAKTNNQASTDASNENTSLTETDTEAESQSTANDETSSDITLESTEEVTQNSLEETENSETTPTESESTPESSSPSESSSNTQSNGNLGIGSVMPDLTALAALDNAAIPYGYRSDDRNELNQPNGCLYYDRLYGSYNADFYRTDSTMVYLTMDEGYENGYTPQILDTLAAKNVKAVFFITYDFAVKNPDLVQRMINEGHIVGNHSYTHPADGIPSLSIEQQYDEFMLTHNYVLENFGYEMYLFRFPEGTFSVEALSLAQSLGYRSVFWSYAYRDWITNDQPDVAASLQAAVSNVHPGAIYLLHACSSTNTTMLGDFIDQVRAQGYEFGYYSYR